MKDDPVIWAAAQLTAAGVENARFEAQLLAALALGVSRASVIARTYPTPTEAQWERFAFLVTQRAQRVPLAYLRGTQEFYGLQFLVTPDVLIPRQETELLVEKVGERIAALRKALESVVLADVGTGSGCIPITLVHTYVGARAVAFDISAQALGVARQNAVYNGVAERVRFVRSDLLAAAGETRFDIVVSNPPYIASEDIGALQAEVRDHEPRLALDGGRDGLHLYRRLVVEARRPLKPGGWLCVEVGQGQAGDVAQLMRMAGYCDMQTYLDFAGIERVVCAQKP
jgi:release factor glutamine methyltransferase